jgi:sRNA-binding carbon storage regulator CsrA
MRTRRPKPSRPHPERHLPGLCIKRKQGEAVILTTPTGERIRICVPDILQTAIKLHISAPAGFGIVREELLYQANDAA